VCPGGVGPWGPFSILRGSYEALSKTGRVRGRCVVGVIIIIIALFYLFFFFSSQWVCALCVVKLLGEKFEQEVELKRPHTSPPVHRLGERHLKSFLNFILKFYYQRRIKRRTISSFPVHSIRSYFSSLLLKFALLKFRGAVLPAQRVRQDLGAGMPQMPPFQNPRPDPVGGLHQLCRFILLFASLHPYSFASFSTAYPCRRLSSFVGLIQAV